MRFPRSLRNPEKVVMIVAPYLAEMNIPFPAPPFIVGIALTTIVSCFGHVSGAHVNPAVSLGIFFSGRNLVDPVKLGGYVVMQCLGGLLAALIMPFIVPDHGVLSVVGTEKFLPSFLTEMMFTSALVSTVLASATAKQCNGNSYYPMTIGASLAGGAFVGGAISGAVYNPAVALAFITYGAPLTSTVAITAGPACGGLISGLLFRLLNRADYVEEKESNLLQSSNTPAQPVNDAQYGYDDDGRLH